MSEILDGVLRMPPELWDNGPVDVAQRHSRYVQAADRIAELEAVLKTILDAHEMSCVDWPAIRKAQALLDNK